MITSRTPSIDQSLFDEDESLVIPVSAGSAPIECRIAAEMTATLQGWLRGLSTRSARHQKYKSRTQPTFH